MVMGMGMAGMVMGIVIGMVMEIVIGMVMAYM